MPEVWHCITPDCGISTADMGDVRGHTDANPTHVMVFAWVSALPLPGA